MRPLLVLLIALLVGGSSIAPMRDPVALCPFDEAVEACPLVDLNSVRLEGQGATLLRTVEIDRAELPLPRPLMVRVIALASSEVRWNGTLIGRNGVPARDAAGEVPGRFVATFVLPAELVRPGTNQLSVRMSAHHLWLPVRTPVHVVEAVPYQGPDLPGLTAYLPALLALGALVAAFAYFAVAGWGPAGERQARLLAAVAAAAMLQLGVEVIRAFVAYPYPWHLARVAAIALLAIATAVLIAAYAADRFARPLRSRLVAATTIASMASLLFIPWYDLKALAAIMAGLLAVLVAALRGAREHCPWARAASAAAVATVALMLWQRTAFLDQAWYVALAAMLVALVAEQVVSLRRVRGERDSERRRSAALAERLSRAERDGEPIVLLKDGHRSHRVAESDILYVRAADDYCDVVLADGRTVMVTTNLARLLATLPERMVRVHRSYLVNRAHVTVVAPRPGGGRAVKLSDGSVVPIGRRYAAAVAAWSA